MNKLKNNDWEKVKLGDIASKVQYGYTESATKKSTGVKFLRITDIVKEIIDWDNVPYCPISTSNFEKHKLKVGDIVVARTGNTTGWAKLIRKNMNAVFASYLIRFQINNKKANHNYIGMLIESNHFKKYVWSVIGGAAQPGANAHLLSDFTFNLPPLPIQEKIAEILSRYDDLIENNLKQIKLLEEMAQITYEEWFIRFRPNGKHLPINKETRLPSGWERKTISYFGDVITGKTPSTKKDEYYGGDILFVKTPDMSKATYSLTSGQKLTKEGAGTQKSKFLPKNSLMVSCIGTAGVVALSIGNTQTNQQINSIVFKKEEYSFYLYCFAKLLKPLLEALGSNGATMVNVNKTKFEQIEVNLPSKEILESFHNKVKNNFELIFDILQQNQKLKEARDILLPRLMTGMINLEDK